MTHPRSSFAPRPPHAAAVLRPFRIPQCAIRNREAGMVAVLTLLIIALMTVMAAGLLAVGFQEARIATNEQGYIQALFNADAGSEEARMRLSPSAPAAMQITPVTNTAWRAYILSGHTLAEILTGLDPTYGKSAASGYTTNESTTNYNYYATVQGAGAITWGWARIQFKVNAGGNIVYLSAVDGTETTAASQVVGGTTVNNFPILWVTTRGVAGTAQREVRLELQPIVQTTTTQTQNTTTVVTDPFGQAGHGTNGVTIQSNGGTDSYKSSLGAYNANGNKFSNGNIGSDATAAQAIDNKGTVNGSAQAGPGANVASAIKNTGTITGTQGTEANTWNIPLSTIPNGIVNQGALTVSGNSTRTLSSGTYWFSSISVTGNGKINVTGPVKIYVTGSIDVGGNGIVNSTAGALPKNVLIYGTVDPNNAANETTSVSVHGNGNFYGAIYAPAAGITVDGTHGTVFGALTGKTVTMNNGKLHWDEDLLDLGATTSTVVTTTSTTTYSTTGFKRYLWNEALL